METQQMGALAISTGIKSIQSTDIDGDGHEWNLDHEYPPKTNAEKMKVVMKTKLDRTEDQNRWGWEGKLKFHATWTVSEVYLIQSCGVVD